jgi:integrase
LPAEVSDFNAGAWPSTVKQKAFHYMHRLQTSGCRVRPCPSRDSLRQRRAQAASNHRPPDTLKQTPRAAPRARPLTSVVDANPCERGGRLYSGNRRDKIWSLEDELAFLDRAPHHLHLPLTLALWTGQRQGDLLRLTRSAYDGNKIVLRQSKTGARVSIPVAPLARQMSALTRTAISVSERQSRLSPNMQGSPSSASTTMQP